jgi:hypothetical protein
LCCHPLLSSHHVFEDGLDGPSWRHYTLHLASPTSIVGGTGKVGRGARVAAASTANLSTTTPSASTPTARHDWRYESCVKVVVAKAWQVVVRREERTARMIGGVGRVNYSAADGRPPVGELYARRAELSLPTL